jgi:hypothetical protein
LHSLALAVEKSVRIKDSSLTFDKCVITKDLLSSLFIGKVEEKIDKGNIIYKYSIAIMLADSLTGLVCRSKEYSVAALHTLPAEFKKDEVRTYNNRNVALGYYKSPWAKDVEEFKKRGKADSKKKYTMLTSDVAGWHDASQTVSPWQAQSPIRRAWISWRTRLDGTTTFDLILPEQEQFLPAVYASLGIRPQATFLARQAAPETHEASYSHREKGLQGKEVDPRTAERWV